MDFEAYEERPADNLRDEILQTSVNYYYDILAQKGYSPSTGRDFTKFELGRDGQLRLKAHPDFDLLHYHTREPLALSTIAGRRGGGAIIRHELGFTDWSNRPLSTEAVAALQNVNQQLGAVNEAVEMQDLDRSLQQATNVLETTFTESQINEVLNTISESPLNLRELRGLDRRLQTFRGELTNNLSKLTELDKHIALEKLKLTEAEDDWAKHEIEKRLKDLEDERASRLEAATSIREELRSQVNRVRETIQRILNEDTTLAERIRTLLREQGITIASVLTAIGMIISTLVFALGGGGGGGVGVPPSKGGWLKNQLNNLARALSKLAEKAAAALPGVISSIVSWLFSTMSKAAGWMAEHLWVMAIAVGGLLLRTVSQSRRAAS